MAVWTVLHHRDGVIPRLSLSFSKFYSACLWLFYLLIFVFFLFLSSPQVTELEYKILSFTAENGSVVKPEGKAAKAQSESQMPSFLIPCGASQRQPVGLGGVTEGNWPGPGNQDCCPGHASDQSRDSGKTILSPLSISLFSSAPHITSDFTRTATIPIYCLPIHLLSPWRKHISVRFMSIKSNL